MGSWEETILMVVFGLAVPMAALFLLGSLMDRARSLGDDDGETTDRNRRS